MSERLVLGTMTFGSQVDRSGAAEMLDACRDAGVTMVDTANVYNAGAAEEMLGDLLAGRDGLRLATKVGMPHADAGDHAPLSASAIRACVEGSLRRLRTDRVELLYLHQPDRSTPVEETLAAVDALVRAGTVGALGVSNYAAWQIAELLRVASQGGFTAPTVSQPIYNLIARRIEDEYVEFAAGAGLTNIVYNPLGGGLLTGKHDFGSGPESGGRFGDGALGATYRQRYWNERLFEAVRALGDVAAAAGLTPIELAFRWLLGRPAVDAVLLGASSVAHLRTNLEAASGPPLDDATLAACDDVWARLYGPAPAYNR
jgi:aryl-alcohol dehydrogenase-like predicted oxidoreductase